MTLSLRIPEASAQYFLQDLVLFDRGAMELQKVSKQLKGLLGKGFSVEDLQEEARRLGHKVDVKDFFSKYLNNN